MSEVFLPKTPAFSALRPSNPEWIAVDSTLEGQIIKWVGQQGELFRMKSTLIGLKGFYWLKGSKSLFIKILEKEHAPLQRQAGKIAKWLLERNINTSPPIESYTKISPNQNLVLFVYRYLKANFSSNSNRDLTLVGSNLVNLHTLLKDNPWQSVIKQNGLEKHKLLVEQLLKIKSSERDSKVPVEAYQRLKKYPTANLDILIQTPSCIHGDLNFGNILFQDNSKKVFFLDFEDSWSAWLNPLVDIAYLIERFILMKSDTETIALATSFLKAYQINGKKIFKKEDDLIKVLQALAIRALILLTIATEKEGNFVSPNEWNKFFKLYEQTISRKSLLRKITKIG